MLAVALGFLAMSFHLPSETVAAPATSSIESRRSPIGMVVDGRVLDSEGRSCSKCRVIAYNTSADDAFSEETDQAGRFVFRNLPAGSYLLTALGPQGYLELRTDLTSVTQQTPLLTLTEGLNASNLTLVAPLPPARGGGAFAAPLAAAAVPSPTLDCGPPPEDRHFNGVAVLTFGRTEAIVPDSATISCGTHQSSLGCESPTITAKSVTVSCLGTLLYPEPWNLQTLVEIHGPSYPGYSAEPPPPAICATFKTQGCQAGLLQYGSYNGTVIHECGHRVVDEKAVAKIFDDLLSELRSIQAELDFCSGTCNCESPGVKDRLRKALDLAAGRIKKHFYERTSGQLEAPAENVECKHYVSLCP